MRALNLPFLRRRATPEVGLYLSSGTVAVASCPPPSHWGGGPVLQCQARRLGADDEPQAVLAALVDGMGLTGARCNLVLAPEFYSLQLVEDPGVAPAELRDALRWRIQDVLDFPAEEAVLDAFALPASAQRGRKAMQFVAALPRRRLQQLVALAQAAGLEPESVDIAELAARNLAYLCYPSPEQGIALLRMGGGGGLLNITRGDELFLSRRIADLPAVLDESNWGRVADSLLLQVQRSIDYYESALNQPPAKGLLLSNAGLMQQPVIEHLGSMLALPVRTLSSVLTNELQLELLNPTPIRLQADALELAQEAALAAASPALGGLLRRILPALLHTDAVATPAAAGGR